MLMSGNKTFEDNQGCQVVSNVHFILSFHQELSSEHFYSVTAGTFKVRT